MFGKLSKFIAAAIVSSAAVGCVATQPVTNVAAPVVSVDETPPDPRLAALASEFEGRVNDGEFQSLAVGVIEKGEVIWAQTWGWADREAGIKATIKTPYGIASAGKSVTGVAAMTLVQNGLLDLDSGVDTVLGDDSIKVLVGSRAPTIRELLNMSGGVPHGALTYTIKEHPGEDEITGRQSFIAFPSGEVYHYSNFSIALVDAVIEKISGESFGDYLKGAIFTPLGMNDSVVGLNVTPKPAARYYSDGDNVGAIEPYPESSRQISVSLADMLKYTALHLKTPLAGQQTVLSDDMIDVMQNQRSGLPGAILALGIGNIDRADGGSWIISSGNDMGVQSNLSVDHDSDVGVVILTNSSGYQADELALRVLDAVSPGFIASVLPAIEAYESRSSAFGGSSAWTGKWSGYAKTPEGDMPVSMAFSPGGGLAVRLGSQEEKAVKEVTLRDGMITGVFEGMLPLSERLDKGHRIELGLYQPKDGEIAGFILANFRSDRGKFELPTFIKLSRTTN